MSAQSELTARGVSKAYGDAVIVDGVDLTLQPGRVVALLGASGAGKSTLLRLLAGLEAVDAGEIRIGDRILSRPDKTVPAEKRRTGLIFQDFALFPHMTAAENVRFGLTGTSKAAGQQTARTWLSRLGLADRANAYPHQLSGGEQQRVAIARALAPAPEAILMDEPFSGLDPALRGEVAEIALSAIREANVPALLVSHDAIAAMETADELAIMRAGRIVQSGTPQAIYDAPADPLIAAALGSAQTFRASELPDGLCPHTAPADALVTFRDEAVQIDPESPVRAQVVRSVCLGPSFRVWMDIGGIQLMAHMARGTPLPQPGETVGVRLDPALTFVFAGNAAHTPV